MTYDLRQVGPDHFPPAPEEREGVRPVSAQSLPDRLVKHLEEEETGWRSVLENPEWDQSGRVHDWRNYVPEYIKEVWTNLGLDARACCFLIACVGADNEVWD